MGAVDVCVGHENDLMVSQFRHVEFLADACSEGRDETLDRFGGQSTVQTRLLDVEDLPANRHDRLVLGIPPVDGRSPRRVALDDEDLALFGIAGRAILKLARHRRRFEDALAASGLTGLAGRRASCEGLKRFANDLLGFTWMHVEPVGQMSIDLLLDEGTRLGVAELGLGLALELGISELDGDDRRQSLADVLA